ncbi:DUF4234 domain-containing protein [Sedimentibacter sp. zth1]|uniref:DUF4234 domain-containing protein n=1 Tax=Sedimentibacter sp. zth1 TaxID=2816908 RepID=UPI001A91D6D4|nr:DUF4234 domain-containing protein [Sedimentibacter sp. zth1]QSX06463.1 DUF4234 domain-containing protein [Sedimentibacter sp. zth1]
MNNQRLRVPKDSRLVYISMFCGLIMLFFNFCTILSMEGEFAILFNVKGYNTGLYIIDIICNIFLIYIPILVFVFSPIFAKRNLRILCIPLAISFVKLLFYSFVFYGLKYCWFDLIAYTVMLVIFILTSTGKIKNKFPLVIVSFLIFVISFVLFITGCEFSNYISYNSYYISSFISFIAPFIAYAIIGLALDNDPNKEYLEKDIISDDATIGSNSQIELLESKDVAVCILLSLVTFGIYFIIWLYSIIKKIKLLNKDQTDCLGELLLCIFVPFYFVYWFYIRAKELSNVAAKQNIQIKDNGTLYLILTLFGLGIISCSLMQNDLNVISLRLKTENTDFNNPNTAYSQHLKAQNEFYQKDPVERLKEIALLKEQCIITEEEYESKKRELLGKI